MTVEELLKQARQYVSYASSILERDRVDFERAAAYSAFAHAAAATAQAMILAQVVTPLRNGEYAVNAHDQ